MWYNPGRDLCPPVSLASPPLVGPVYALASAPVGVVAGVGSAVVIYEERGDTLVPVAQQSGFSVVLDVGVSGDGTKIMVADLMRSVSLLAYNASNHTLSLISRDTTPRWLSAAILVDDATGTRVVFADSNFNLGVLEQNTRAADEEIVRLSNVGEQYCGDFINRCVLQFVRAGIHVSTWTLTFKQPLV